MHVRSASCVAPVKKFGEMQYAAVANAFGAQHVSSDAVEFHHAASTKYWKKGYER